MYRGFTLIELVMSLAMIAILAAAALPMAELVVQRNHERDLRKALNEIREALDMFKRASDDGRIPRAVGASGYPANLNLLVNGVKDAKDPRGRFIYFLRRLPRDPMEPNADIPAEQTWGIRSYSTSSSEPKFVDDVYDVYSLSPKTGLNGLAYREW